MSGQKAPSKAISTTFSMIGQKKLFNNAINCASALEASEENPQPDDRSFK